MKGKQRDVNSAGNGIPEVDTMLIQCWASVYDADPALG